MATKTVSIDELAYEKLVRAKRHARESFSKVIHRAHWDEGIRRCGGLLDRATGSVSDADLDALDRAQAEDVAPEDKWSR